MMENEWHENTGTVPEEVKSNTVIEVEYQGGNSSIWDNDCCCQNDDPTLWEIIENSSLNVVRWRFVK